MKLWDLSVRLDVGSNGTEKRAKLYEVAEEIRAADKHAFVFDKNRTSHIYIVTGDLMTADEIGESWKGKGGSETDFGVDLVPRDIDPEDVAAYFGVDPGEIKRMLYEAYGRFSDIGKAAADGIKRGIQERRNSSNRDDENIASAMSKMILQTIELMPRNMVDRKRSMDLLEQMLAIYLRFRAKTQEEGYNHEAHDD